VTTEEKIKLYLNSLKIIQPAKSFVREVSNIYHKHEAEIYDNLHLEISETTAYWKACFERIQPGLSSNLAVLDIGSGTGFASEQIIRCLQNNIAHLVCNDLSEYMLKQCKARLKRFCDKMHIEFICGEPTEVFKKPEQFDIILTSAVLHHLMDLPSFLYTVKTILRPDGYYIAGHEPSSLFYLNKELYKWTLLYRRCRRIKNFFKIMPYLRKIGVSTPPKSIEEMTNDEMMERGIISDRLPLNIIRQLVDIHVPPASGDIPFFGEVDFNAESITKKYLRNFEISYVVTYPHIKDAVGRMGPVWRKINNCLSRKYHGSGANFMMAVRKVK
jgi:SAM-dependent methyltransferase